jgi:hypothetical protein
LPGLLRLETSHARLVYSEHRSVRSSAFRTGRRIRRTALAASSTPGRRAAAAGSGQRTRNEPAKAFANSSTIRFWETAGTGLSLRNHREANADVGEGREGAGRCPTLTEWDSARVGRLSAAPRHSETGPTGSKRPAGSRQAPAAGPLAGTHRASFQGAVLLQPARPAAGPPHGGRRDRGLPGKRCAAWLRRAGGASSNRSGDPL